MNFTLNQILTLVGKLDDSPGEQTSSKRFRTFLRENIKEIAVVRDYIEECLRSKDDQYNRALQDLVNYVGEFLGFQVEYGRYRGVQGEIGFDGHWISPTGFHVVIEVKTTEVYAVKTSTLVGYINELISNRSVPSWEEVIGLYVIGRPNPEIKTLINGIVAERRNDQLRVISSNALVSMAELINDYDISHDDILQVVKPSGPSIDAIADLMARLTAQRVMPAAPLEPMSEPMSEEPQIGESTNYWLTPVGSDEVATADEVIKTLVGEQNVYAFGERTPGRKRIKPGDWIAFYSTGKGVVAHAKVSSFPAKGTNLKKIRHPEDYPWVFQLSEPTLYLDKPVVIDADMRSRLATFKGRKLNSPWAWFVQATRRISEEDFRTLTNKK